MNFKECSNCSKVWRERGDFLADPDVKTVGYWANFEDLKLGLFLFNHEECKTTLGIRALEFMDLYDGPVFESRLTDSGDCPGYCLLESELRSCPAKCECAWVREVLDKVATWSKTQGSVVRKA
jgi:hypothetical protein